MSINNENDDKNTKDIKKIGFHKLTIILDPDKKKNHQGYDEPKTSLENKLENTCYRIPAKNKGN
jgi:hypothetical protein